MAALGDSVYQFTLTIRDDQHGRSRKSAKVVLESILASNAIYGKLVTHEFTLEDHSTAEIVRN